MQNEVGEKAALKETELNQIQKKISLAPDKAEATKLEGSLLKCQDDLREVKQRESMYAQQINECNSKIGELEDQVKGKLKNI